jgi:hypothetical protein
VPRAPGAAGCVGLHGGAEADPVFADPFAQLGQRDGAVLLAVLAAHEVGLVIGHAVIV